MRGIAAVCAGASLFVIGVVAQPAEASSPTARDHHNDSRSTFRHELSKTVRADHPAILPVVAAIRAISNEPREQLMIVNDVTHLLVDYDEDERVYGKVEFHATLDEMIQHRREAGWLYLRDDCDGRAIFAAHLLAALGIHWRLEASYWKRHAWITATVDGVEYDLLDLRRDAPERREVSYQLVGHWFTKPTRVPPYFDWRQAWMDRTHGDIAVGLRLGMLELGSTPGHLRERFSTDWTLRHPEGRESPFDGRTLTAAYAGFPYGEPLHVGAVASVPSAKPTESEHVSARASLGQSSALPIDRVIGEDR